jgi:hypothetical protein
MPDREGFNRAFLCFELGKRRLSSSSVGIERRRARHCDVWKRTEAPYAGGTPEEVLMRKRLFFLSLAAGLAIACASRAGAVPISAAAMKEAAVTSPLQPAQTPGLPLLKTRSARSFYCYSPARPKKRSHVSSELNAWSSKALLADETGGTSHDQQTSAPQFATGRS